MILTVTPNTALDRVYFLPELRRNRRNQADGWVESMGGKGCNVALILAALGEEVVAAGLAAGETGRRMEAILRRGGVTPDFVWTGGETRVNTVLVETGSGSHTTLCAAGLEPHPDSEGSLLASVGRWSRMAAATVIAGSLPEGWPAGTYARLVEAAGPGPVVVDASGLQLAAALEARPAAVKPNLHELESVTHSLDPASADSAARSLRERGAGWVMASMGGGGALLVSNRGAWRAPALDVRVVNPSGAGDGMTACLVLGLTRAWDEAETLRWAVAVSASIVTTRGTGELSVEQARSLLPDVRIERL